MAKKRSHVEKGRLFVLIGLVLLAVAAVGNFYWLHGLSDRVNLLYSTVLEDKASDFYRGWYRDVQVSSDAEWYILPEVRLRFPYKNLDVVFGSLSYKYSYYSDGTEEDESGTSIPEGFEIAFAATDFMSYDVPYAESRDKDINELICMDAFVISDDPKRLESSEEHEAVHSKILESGRSLTIWRSKSERCARLVESDRGTKLLDALKEIQSF